MYKFDDVVFWIKSNWEKVTLFLLILITYNQWIFHFGYLVGGDWIFHNREFLVEFYQMPQMWDSFWNFGSVDIMPVVDFFQFCYGFFAQFFDYAILERLFYFWTIPIFSYIGILKLGKIIFKEDKVGIFFFAILFLFNTYILSVQTSFMTYANVYALSPIVFYLFIKLLNEKFNLKNVIPVTLILLVCSFYEPRGLVALSYFLTLYFLYMLLMADNIKSAVDRLFSYVSVYLVFIILNVYWLIPQLLLTSSSEIVSTNNVFVAFNSILDSFSFHNYAWQGNIFEGFSNVAFHKVVPSFYFFIITIITFSSVLFYKKLKDRRFVVFLLATSLIGVFLLKQQNQPFGIIYEWLFQHLPTFNLFRESNKFILFFLPISLLFGLSVSFIVSKIKVRSVRVGFLTVVSLLVLINIKPIVDQQIQSVFVNHSIPGDYVVLNKFILSQSDYLRTFFVPRSSNWAINTNNHPKISQVDLLGYWMRTSEKIPTGQSMIDMLRQNYSDNLLDIFSVGYIIVPIRDTANADDFFQYYGDRGFFIQELDKLSYLKRIDIGTKDLVVYENENYRPHIYTTYEKETIYKEVPFGKVDFQFKNPTEYAVNLKNVSAPVYVNFSEKYHSDWKLRAGNFQWFDVLRHKDYFLSDVNHFENDAKLNSFLVDPKEVCGNDSKEGVDDKSVCIKNVDGSYDINLTLYFKPQSYFYLGLIISGTTLIGCLGYLVYAWWVGRKTNKK